MAPVNQARKTDNDTPLLLATEGGHEKIVRLLLDKGADASVARNDGVTPLSAALSRSSRKIVKLLLKNGAELVLR